MLINKDGFKIRVALVANDESDCDSCNSWLGCGCTNGEFGGICANWALARVADNGGKDTPRLDICSSSKTYDHMILRKSDSNTFLL